MAIIDMNGHTIPNSTTKQDPMEGIVKCQNPECKCLFYSQAYMLKKISKIQRPDLAQDTLGVIPVFICLECGTILNQNKI